MKRTASWPSALLAVVVASFVPTGCETPEADAEQGSKAAAPGASGESAAPPASSASEVPTERKYQAAPNFVLENVAGGTLELASFRGKVVLVDFWATWCRPCVASIPHLNELYKDHQEDGFEIVGVSLDRPRRGMSGADQVRAFTQRTPMDYPTVMCDAATNTAYGGIRSIPTAFLIDRQGNVRKRFVGMQPRSVFETAVQDLLAEPEDGTI